MDSKRARLQILDENLQRELQLQAEYMTLLGLEADPRARYKHQLEIDRLNSSIASIEVEMQALSSQPARKSEPAPDFATDLAHMVLTREERVMVLVPGGQFLYDAEQTIVFLPKPYYIDRYPVTNADYRRFLDATERPAPGHWPEGDLPLGTERHPVVGLTYSEVQSYVEWSGKRLPTEQEWEKAARGTDGRLWPWGQRFDEQLCAGTWRLPEEQRSAFSIGVFSPAGDSPYGVGDIGILWEWTSSWYSYRRYKVVRGGPWRNLTGPALVINRSFEDDRAHDVGFRCVCDVDQVDRILTAVVTG